MLSEALIHAAIPTQDLDRARVFYEGPLGLTPAAVEPGGVFYEGRGGTRFLLFPSSGRASGEHTQLGFLVDDLASEVRALKARGVSFESYDMPQFDPTSSIASFGPTRSAWFKDPDGNLLGLVEMAGEG